MKKMKGVVAAIESSTLRAPMYEDARTRFKHQSLLQDYEDLYKRPSGPSFSRKDPLDKETEAKSKKLQMTRQKRFTLLAEVRFLRQRYKYLKENPAQKPTVKQDIVQPQKLLTGSRGGRMERSCNQKDVVSWQPVPRFDSNQKEKIHGERKVVLGNPALGSKLKQKLKPQIRKEASLRAKLLIPDLNQKERICVGKEATVQINTPIFDLNEISREEEESQANDEPMRLEEPKISLLRNGNDEQHNDVKLLACRNIGKGSTQGSKRKISWLDQVALRV